MNLLPDRLKILQKWRVRLRAILTALVLVNFVLLTAFFVTVPMFFWANLKIKEFKNELTQTKSNIDISKYREDLKHIKDMISKIESIDKIRDDALVDDIFVLSESAFLNGGINITSFKSSLSKDGKEVNITISATAKNRDYISMWQKAIKKTGRFKEISLPISSLAQKENISFVLKLKRDKYDKKN